MTGSVTYPPHPHEAPRAGSAVSVSAALLVGVNLVPLAGVVTGAMSLGDVFLVYWAENIVVAAFTVVRILTARGAAAPITGVPAAVASVGLAMFFCVHFGIFTAVHGAFTFTLVSMTSGMEEVSRSAIFLVLASLVVSHGYSLVVHWFRRGERDRTTSQQAMGAPYPRMVVLHVSIIGSFFLLFALADPFTGSPGGPVDRASELLPVLLLTVLKTALDVTFHLRTHRRWRADAVSA